MAYFVAVLVPEELTVARVEHRVAAGGTTSPRTRSGRAGSGSGGHVAEMADLADHVEVSDNAGDAPRIVALFVDGELVGHARWPRWTPPALTARQPFVSRTALRTPASLIGRDQGLWMTHRNEALP